eukprot:TRINITY_DN1499_c0_g1_i4.p1 TRINITY_DN1499_c0_g1~~TRINITY_DN1499_c0_g1_i4.p1  ORF type:complete len:160 (+),score=63.18 TRINITY_DN1499_c0_g1_i4:118-597(+)
MKEMISDTLDEEEIIKEAQKTKEEGNKFFVTQNYENAIEKYSNSIEILTNFCKSLHPRVEEIVESIENVEINEKEPSKEEKAEQKDDKTEGNEEKHDENDEEKEKVKELKEEKEETVNVPDHLKPLLAGKPPSFHIISLLLISCSSIAYSSIVNSLSSQ